MRLLKQSTAYDLMVFMVDDGDHITGLAGLTLTITASKQGAAFASISPTVTDRSNGWYEVQLTTAHTDTLGDLAIHITATGADPTDLVCQVGPVHSDTIQWLGGTVQAATSGVPNVNLITWRDAQPNGLTSNRVDVSVGAMASGVVTATAIATDAITSAELASTAVSEIADAVWGADPASYTSSSQIGFYVLKLLKPLLARTATAAAGGASTVTLDGSASSTDDFYNGALIIILSGTGSGQFRQITDYVGFTKVATVDRAWSTNPDATSVFSIVTWASPSVTAIRDGLLDYAYRSGRTVRGLFRRLGASLEVATGLLGSTATFKQPDGTTTEYSVTQDVANGARTAVVVTNSETP